MPFSFQPHQQQDKVMRPMQTETSVELPSSTFAAVWTTFLPVSFLLPQKAAGAPGGPRTLTGWQRVDRRRIGLESTVTPGGGRQCGLAQLLDVFDEEKK